MDQKIKVSSMEEYIKALGCPSLEVFEKTLDLVLSGEHLPKVKNSISLMDLIDLYIADSYNSRSSKLLVGSEHTRKSQLNALKKQVEEICQCSAAQIMFENLKYGDIHSYCGALTKKGKPPSTNTYNNRLGAFQSLCKFARQRCYAVPSWHKELLYKDREESLPKYFKYEEVIELLYLAKSSRLGIRNHAMVSFLVITGCRVSELRHIKYSQIDWEKRTIENPLRKKRSKKRIFLTKTLLTILQNYIKIDRPDLLSDEPISEYLFCNLYSHYMGKQLTTKNVEKVIDRLIIKLNISDPERQNLTCHSLRHTCAVLALMNGLQITEVQELLGHRCLTTTQIYTKVTNSHLQSKIEEHSPFNEVTMEKFRERGTKAVLRSL